MSIDDWRRRINELDTELLRLLNERAGIALKVGESKKEAGVSLCDHTREREVIERMCAANEGPLDNRAIIESIGPSFMSPAGFSTGLSPSKRHRFHWT